MSFNFTCCLIKSNYYFIPFQDSGNIFLLKAQNHNKLNVLTEGEEAEQRELGDHVGASFRLFVFITLTSLIKLFLLLFLLSLFLLLLSSLHGCLISDMETD